MEETNGGRSSGERTNPEGRTKRRGVIRCSKCWVKLDHMVHDCSHPHPNSPASEQPPPPPPFSPNQSQESASEQPPFSPTQTEPPPLIQPPQLTLSSASSSVINGALLDYGIQTHIPVSINEAEMEFFLQNHSARMLQSKEWGKMVERLKGTIAFACYGIIGSFIILKARSARVIGSTELKCIKVMDENSYQLILGYVFGLVCLIYPLVVGVLGPLKGKFNKLLRDQMKLARVTIHRRKTLSFYHGSDKNGAHEAWLHLLNHITYDVMQPVGQPSKHRNIPLSKWYSWITKSMFIIAGLILTVIYIAQLC